MAISVINQLINRITGSPANMQGNPGGDLMVAQGASPFYESNRAGNIFTILTATPFAPVAALPTTTAALEVFNGTSGSAARDLEILDVLGFQLLSTAATQTYAVWASPTTQKAAPTLTALSVFYNNGKGFYTPTAVGAIVTGVNTTVIANGWRPYGPVQAWGTAAATPGNSLEGQVNGKIVVPPQCSVVITIVGSIATASSFHAGVTAAWKSPAATPITN